MRKILFRGKREDNGKWTYGDLLQVPSQNCYSIMGQSATAQNYKINPETLGQYTEVIDENGKKIFEGDIVELAPLRGIASRHIIDYIPGGFRAKIIGTGYDAYLDDIDTTYVTITVIGNIHDNPELLEV